MASAEASAEFAQISQPSKDLWQKKVVDFCAHCLSTKRKLVLVTSGGTTVPLEKNTVRFVDNFSAGTRGSASTEYFLAAGYAVIFLHRHNSLMPFNRHCKKNLFDSLIVDDAGTVAFDPSHSSKMATLLRQYQIVQSEGRYLPVDFTTIHEYISHLRLICECLKTMGNQAMIYLAAAVSDFYIPYGDLPQHKIQSDGGALSLQMSLVPKLLRPIVMETVPEAYVVSFKLETDPSLLIPKSRAALAKYGHQLVIGNILSTRKERVVMVEGGHHEDGAHEDDHVDVVEVGDAGEIEEKIVKYLKDKHEEYIGKM